jgi:hypothetical protein
MYLVFASTACINKVDPMIDTLYLEGKDRRELRLQAIPKLYEHFRNSKKDKFVYEVISKKNGRFIANYTPSLKLLTLTGDPGSGWGNQFKDVDETTLEKLVKDGITFDDLELIGTLDSKYNDLLVETNPFQEVRTNGSPSN